jgi:predicted permease
MDAILRFSRKLWLRLRRQRFHDELGEEMAFHREQLQRQLQADGMPAEEARYAAARRLGNMVRLQEEALDSIGFGCETVLQDFRYGLRQLRKNPVFAATAVLILALGLGAATAIFSAVNPILFRPLPYPHPARLAMVWERNNDGNSNYVTFGTYYGLMERSRVFQALAVIKPWQPTVTGPAQPERLEGQRVSFAYFRALGIVPALGRDFQAADDQYRGPNVVILSHRLWTRRFGADGGIVGRQVRLDDNSFTVIGVMPAGFENVLAPAAELWAPLQYNPALPPDGREWGHHLRMVGRLQPNVSRAQAASEMDAILRNLASTYAQGYASSGGPPAAFIVRSLQADLTAGVRPALLAVLGAVLLLLLIACVNVANLLLARGAQRRGEFAMRAALGAERPRLLRQLLTESLLLALCGGALAIAVAEAGVRALVALSPPELPRLSDIHLDAAVFLFGLLLTTIVGLLVGLMPALLASRVDLRSGMQKGSRTTAGRRPWTRRVLVVAEVALALVLLISAGLLLRSFQRIFAVAPGFDPSHLLTMQVQESGRRFDNSAARYAFFDRALQAVRQVPGVVSAGFTAQLPLSGDYEVYGTEFEKDHGPQGNDAFRYAVTPGYLETMRIPLRRGRLLDEHDTAAAPRVVLISEALAQHEFHGMDPLGQRVRLGPDIGHPDRPWYTVVGVVGDVKQGSLELSEADAFYVSNQQWAWADNVLSLVVRARGDAAALAPAVRNAIWSVDKDQAVSRVATMQRLLDASEAERRFALIVFEAFALVGLALAATGIYGVLSGSVTERTREIGVRAALGATRADLLVLVVRQGMILVVLGLALGLLGAMVASRALLSLLFEVSPLDAATYLGVSAMLVGVSAMACWAPAWRAARVNPAVTLRAE